VRARDPLPAQLRFSILQRDGFRCRYCGRTGGDPGVVLHVDHVVPLAAGGATREDNLRTACEECNLGKAARAVVTARP
jgi:5-methylcytosine-specific restriction endonuclease McrA